MTSNSHRIDVHHHVVSPELVTELARRNIEWTGGVGVPKWNPSLNREVMARHGIDAAILSIQPQVFWGDMDTVAEWARRGNEFLAGVVQDDFQHFGGFASLPLPDADAACREAEYALDTLGLDGVLLISSAGGYYPGDPRFEELFQELDKRSAVVFIHPNTLPPGADVPKIGLPYAIGEFTFDTTRTAANLMFSGTLERYPSIKFILAHAGGTIPYLAWRLSLGELSPRLKERVPKGTAHYLKSLYYETALSASDPQLAALQQFVPNSHIVFGSDFPMAPLPVIDAITAMFDSSPVVTPAARAAINRNALALFPRFASTPVAEPLPETFSTLPQVQR